MASVDFLGLRENVFFLIGIPFGQFYPYRMNFLSSRVAIVLEL
jgi:hypothetical protein